MYTGWRAFLGQRFAVQRSLNDGEIESYLDRRVSQQVSPYEWGSLLHLNSTYAEFLDRWYRLRGMLGTAASFVAAMLGLILAVLVAPMVVEDLLSGAMLDFTIGLGAILCLVAISLGLWHITFRYDVFEYTHYPVRFNRKEKMIYVFRPPAQGGVLEVPWEKAYFHIGVGATHKFVRDLRAHVMEDGIVTDTFTVGHYFDDTQLDRVRSLWEFIRLYMEEGPEAVGPHPLDRLVSTSPNQTLRNCYVHVAASLGGFLYSIRYVAFPIYAVLTLSRWIVFKTCKAPTWPAHVEEKCRIEPNDPHLWKEPSFTNEFTLDPTVYEHGMRKMAPFLRR